MPSQEETLLETRRAHRKALKKSARAGASVGVDFDAEVDHQCEEQQQRRRIEGVVAVWKKKTFSRARKGRGGVEVDDEGDDLEMDLKVCLIDLSSISAANFDFHIGVIVVDMLISLTSWWTDWLVSYSRIMHHRSRHRRHDLQRV